MQKLSKNYLDGTSTYVLNHQDSSYSKEFYEIVTKTLQSLKYNNNFIPKGGTKIDPKTMFSFVDIIRREKRMSVIFDSC